MWEKKVAFDGVANADDAHDADNKYPRTGLCADLGACQPCAAMADPCPRGCAPEAGPCAPPATAFAWLAELNARRFATYDDWRLPTEAELHTLFDPAYFVPDPDVPPPRVHRGLHDPGCGSDCTDLTDPACSCTAPAPYWSSTLVQGAGRLGWAVSFGHPGTGSGTSPLSRHHHLRAVRGGASALE
jgi:hypothetical protein